MSKRALKVCLVICLFYGTAILYGRYNGAQARKAREEQQAAFVSKEYSDTKVWGHNGRKPVVLAYPKINKPTATPKPNNWLLVSIENIVSETIVQIKQIPWNVYMEQTKAFVQKNIIDKSSQELISIKLIPTTKPKTPVVYYKPNKANVSVVVPIKQVPIQYVSVQQEVVSRAKVTEDVGYCPPAPRGNFDYKIVSYRH